MAKAEFKNIMINILDLVETICEKYPVESQEYLNICNEFKNANLKFDDLMGAVNQLKENTYYNNYVRNGNTKNNVILSDEQKSLDDKYMLCECGCYVRRDHIARHKNTDKHHKLIRNKKMVLKKKNLDISEEISKELKLSALMLKKQTLMNEADNNNIPLEHQFTIADNVLII